MSRRLPPYLRNVHKHFYIDGCWRRRNTSSCQPVHIVSYPSLGRESESPLMDVTNIACGKLSLSMEIGPEGDEVGNEQRRKTFVEDGWDVTYMVGCLKTLVAGLGLR